MTNQALRLMNRRGEYRIRNAAESVTEILLYDEIGEDPWFGGGVSAKTFVEDLQAANGNEIHLRINSPGGSVFEGITMLNALRRYEAKVTVFVDGLAASAASVVAMGGDEVVMSRNAEMMIHDASGICLGNAEDMASMADLLAKSSDNLAAAYAERAGGTVNQWRKAMQAETWYTDKEAVQAGLADRVDNAKTAADKAKARFNLAVYNYAGRAEAPAPDLPAEPPESPSNQEGADGMSDTLNLRERLGLKAEATDEEVSAKLDEVLKNTETPTDPPDDAADDSPDDDSEDTPDDESGDTPSGGDGEPTMVVSKAQWEALKASAKDGREARNQQRAEHRESLVTAALRDGRIAASEKADWLKALELDAGKEKILAALPKGLVPVGEPHGYTGSLADVGEDDEIYNKLFDDEKAGV